MDISMLLLILAVGGLNVYFLVRPSAVTSVRMLRVSWTFLGGALIFPALFALPGSNIKTMLVAGVLRDVMLGCSVTCLVFVVHPADVVAGVKDLMAAIKSKKTNTLSRVLPDTLGEREDSPG